MFKWLSQIRKTKVLSEDTNVGGRMCLSLSAYSAEISKEYSLDESTSKLLSQSSKIESEICETESLKSCLRKWALMNNIRHTALKDLGIFWMNMSHKRICQWTQLLYWALPNLLISTQLVTGITGIKDWHFVFYIIF